MTRSRGIIHRKDHEITPEKAPRLREMLESGEYSYTAMCAAIKTTKERIQKFMREHQIPYTWIPMLKDAARDENVRFKDVPLIHESGEPVKYEDCPKAIKHSEFESIQALRPWVGVGL